MSNLPRAIVAAAIAAVLCVCAGLAGAEQIEVLWLGHSTFRITSTTGKVIVVDPYLKKNPRTPAKYKELGALGKVDLILVTHGHGDHVRDLEELARLTGATVVAPYELATNFIALGWLDGTKTIAMNKGGTVEPLGPSIKVHMVPAVHSSSVQIDLDKPETKGLRYFYGGEPVGYVIEFENGFKIYDTGDTDVFGDMALIGRLFKPDLALVCMGGHFTMGPDRAAFALREYIRPKQVIPQHYGTYPVINRTPAELKSALAGSPIKVLEMKPGETLRF